MTATPIPRSLALAHYGDMDLSRARREAAGPPARSRPPLDLRPAAPPEVIEHLRRAIAEGRQAYWVCPLVAESETAETTAAEERFRALRAALGADAVGLVHGQLPPAAKDAAMADFVAGRTRLLVATTVIEVGVNVPNASIMVIEGAQTFGLAQLHQLRGRVGRGAARSTCLLLYDPPLGETARARLETMRATEDGFVIAEEDLRAARRRRPARRAAVGPAALPHRRPRDPGRPDAHRPGRFAPAARPGPGARLAPRRRRSACCST